MKSYSHPATRQDLWVLNHIRNPNLATFLELGAYDGLTHSNTLLLEEQGWTGTLVEGLPKFYEHCKRNRPKAKCINAFIGPHRGGDYVFIGGQYTGLQSAMPDKWIEEHKKRNAPRMPVNVVPIYDVFGARRVDYFSLDTEGGEADILESWFRAGYTCCALSVEFRFDSNLLVRLERIANDYGMHLDEIRGFDACFLENGM